MIETAGAVGGADILKVHCVVLGKYLSSEERDHIDWFFMTELTKWANWP